MTKLAIQQQTIFAEYLITVFYSLVVTSAGIFILDLAAKIDQCAEFVCKAKWGDLEFPPPFGRDALPEVRH